MSRDIDGDENVTLATTALHLCCVRAHLSGRQQSPSAKQQDPCRPLTAVFLAAASVECDDDVGFPTTLPRQRQTVAVADARNPAFGAFLRWSDNCPAALPAEWRPWSEVMQTIEEFL